MKQFRTALGFSLILITLDGYAASLQDKNISKSCVGAKDEKDKKNLQQKEDIFVGLNSFTAYKQGFNQKMKEVPVKDKMLYAYAGIGISAASLQTAFPLLQLALCNEEYAIDNKCHYNKPIYGGHLMGIETNWKTDTQYTMTQYVTSAGSTTKTKKLIISSELPNYWNGSMKLFNDDGSQTELSWSRSDNGTEYYDSRIIGGTDNSSIAFTEYPDCSANTKYVKNDVEITANWSLVGDKTTGKFEYCNKKDCRYGEW